MRNIILSLVFAITAIVVQAQAPVITMTTSQPNGSEVEFYLTSFGDNTLVMVDWGDGRLEDFRIGQSNTTISGVTIGDAIKIYGPGITGLYASNLSLTSLDIFEAISLTSLTVSNNQLQSLDISGNTNLQYLDCSRNQLETLSLTTNIKLERISCFSNKLTTIDITSNAALWKLDCSNNLMTTLNFSAITKNVDIDCSNNLLTSLTLGKKMSSVRCKNNALTNLDVSQNTSLFLLDCSNNQINSLNLSNNANLQYLICSNNKLSSLDLSHNSSLTEVYCDNNKLTLATLPIKQTYWNVYSYNPQAIYSLPKKTYETGESIDLSSQLSVNGVNSVYTWKTKGGQTLSAGTHFTATNGVFVFNSVPTDSVYCEITNTDLTDITLTTKAIMVTEPVPNVVITTATAVGSTFTFIIGSLANDTPIQIDWGNGGLENYTIGTSSTTVSGTLAGGTIKIYGLGIVRLDLSDKKLTALDVSNNAALKELLCRDNKLTSLNVTNNTALTNLDCHYNQLTALDVSNNIALTNLSCSYNQLTALDVTKNNALTDLECSSNQLTTLDVSKNIALTNLNCGFNKLTALDVSKNTALTSLFCSSTQLTALDVTKNIALTNLYCYNIQLTTLDVTNNTALEELYCSHNQLTALDVTNITALTSLNCYNNQLTALNLTNNTALTVLRCSDNLLTFSTLPVQHPNWTTYTYSPQEKLPLSKNEIALNEEIDLSSQLTAGDNTTTYVWKTIDGVALIKDVDYTENNGKFVFLKPLRDFFYCEMSNATFPELTLTTKYIFITQTEPSITMATATTVGSTFSFGISATVNNTPIKVDWGNGSLENYAIGTSSTTVSGTLAGNTIKIYGLGIVRLGLTNKELTALDVTNTTALKKLECDYNQLTFSTLPIQHPSWTDYTYSPQGKLSLSKNELAINEEIDLGSHLTAGGNTTTYVWKTKGGVMLIKDVDYTESNGKFTFLKQPGDYFYCEMRNTTFPELTLATENIFITTGTDEPSITMTTTTAVGSTFSFDISTTTYNTPIKVDWGNGSLFSYTIGGRSTVSGKLAGNTIKIYGVGISCLYLQGKKLTALDVTNTIALTELICFNNQLTALDVTNNTALTELLCSDNLLTALDVTSNTALKLLSCFNNQLTFSALPVPNASWTTYRYSPQEKVFLAKTDYELNEEIDLSSQLAAEGNTTTYVWKTLGGVTLIKDVDYTESNGKFTFIKQPGDYFYFEMSNATFPKLTLTTDNIFIIPDQPSIIMTTAATYYSNFTITLKTKARNVPIKIDWGNGILINEMVYNSYSTSTSLVGNTIKIYGLGIEFLSMPNKKLTSLDVSNNTELAELDCHFNHLTSLDVSNNAALTKLNCSDNYLTFSTLPVRKPTWTSYSYSPQSAVKLPKKQYALTEAVDLSSELDVNGNTTNYTWKTKGGATLVAGIDYNVVGGVTTFLRVQTDSVYCQMTNATFPELTLNTINIKVSAYPLSVEDNEVAISVYPNPATENFTIKMTEEIVRVEVYSITGVRVFENGQYSSPTVTVPLTNMPKGTLLIKAYTRNGVYSSKVVKI